MQTSSIVQHDETDPAGSYRGNVLPPVLRGRRAALVIAHPGHELRVYHWLKLSQPTVFVLTDGSGRTGNSRIQRTTSILQACGADFGTVYGRVTDAGLYDAIIRQDAAYFVGLAAELADCFRRKEIDYVVGDALEGYNPAHDLCRYLTNAAIMSLPQDGKRPENYDVLIGNRNGAGTELNGRRGFSFELEPGPLAEKLQMAQTYTELMTDVQRVLTDEGIESVKTEQLRYLSDFTFGSSSETPHYEVYGRQQVASGHYRELLTYRDHLRPIAEALRTWAR
jgi:hypothetical protein